MKGVGIALEGFSDERFVFEEVVVHYFEFHLDSSTVGYVRFGLFTIFALIYLLIAYPLQRIAIAFYSEGRDYSTSHYDSAALCAHLQ